MNPNNQIYVAIIYDGNENRAISVEFEGEPTFGPLGRKYDVEDALRQGLNLDHCDLTALIRVTPQAGGMIDIPDVVLDDEVWEGFDVQKAQARPIHHVRIREDGLITADMP